MINKQLFLFSNCTIIRKDNNLYLKKEDETKRPFPIKTVEMIYCIGRVNIDSYALSFLFNQNILIYFFDFNGRFSGNGFPESPQQVNKSGFVLLQQLRAFDDDKHRLYIAKQITVGHLKNCYENVNKVMNKDILLKSLNDLENTKTIKEIMGVEGNFKREYYQCWNLVIKNQKSFKFMQRSKRPPVDKINSMISFINTIIYSFVLSEIYKTELDPRIGFLHEPNYKHLSLHLDIAEIFKPLIGDKVLFRLLNKNMITSKSFSTKNKMIRLISEAKQIIIKELLEEMETIVEINKQRLNRYLLIRREVNQIKKTIVEYSEYTPFDKEILK